MSITRLLFKLIDYFGYIPQNSYHNKNAKLLLKNEVYCAADKNYSTFDLYCNKNSQNLLQPVLINLHGGGFVAGDKKYRKSFSEYCTKFNIKVLNINYGLAPNKNLIEILDNLTFLFDWIKSNSQTYGLDNQKIILCGDSAGAYIAACISALCISEEYASAINLSKIDTKIIGNIFFSGIYFPTDSLDKHMVLNINHSLWGYLSGEKFVDTATCQKHNLYNKINIGDFVTKDFPPTFVAYSVTDIFCKGNGEKLIEKLKENNIPYYSVCSANNMHDWQENMFTKSAKLTLKHFDKFMTELLDNNLSNTTNCSINIKNGKLIK